MKAVIGIISGFVVSLFMFAGGAGIAAYLLAVEPVPDQRPSQNTADLWSAEPRRIDAKQQEFTRTASIAPEGKAAELTTTSSGYPVEDDNTELAMAEPAELDLMPTGSADARQETEIDRYEEADFDRPSRHEIMGPLLVAHLDWCRDQYRSYSPETNTYRAYRGGERECVSPYMEDIQAAAAIADQDYASSADVELDRQQDASSMIYYAANDRQPSMSVDTDHMRDCARRYRSYRFEDNTYQPYGGGPRRQCM